MPGKNSTKAPSRNPSAKVKANAGVTKKAQPQEAADLLDMDQAIQLLKTSRPTFYRWLREGRVSGMKLGRQWRFERQQIERFLKGEAPRIDLPASIDPLLETLRSRLKEAGGAARLSDKLNPVQQAIRLMILLAHAIKASDVHITPHVSPNGETIVSLRNRVDGVLHQAATVDPRLLPALIEEWKRMAACNVQEKLAPQDGRIMITLNELGGGADQSIDLRVSFLPAVLGESLTVRLLDRLSISFDLKRLDYAPGVQERLHRALKFPWGMIFFTGPVGCGKTTALYCCLGELARPEQKVMSIEDPVEFYLPWVTQVQVNAAAGLTFARAMRSMMRSDPDVILVGEIRDLETLSVAQQAALTGHLVFSTLHTNDAAGALKRMVEVGSNPFVVADSTRLIVAQRLVRLLCKDCSVAEQPNSNRLAWCADVARRGGLDWESLPRNFRTSVGCDKCAGTGYRGRTVVAEALEVAPEISDVLRNNASCEELRAVAVGQGMVTMAADGVRRAAAGETSITEILRVLG